MNHNFTAAAYWTKKYIGRPRNRWESECIPLKQEQVIAYSLIEEDDKEKSDDELHIKN